MARNVTLSKPLPINYFGIETSDGSGNDILAEGLPAIAADQRYIFDGGQFGGLSKKLEKPLEVEITYDYRNPIGIKRKRKEFCILSVNHIQSMPSRISAEQAIVESLKGPNTTTLQKIQEELVSINTSLHEIVQSQSDVRPNK
ncbi:hypothetical protein N9W57_00130 [Pseudomonadales bacterium]|nr:hypothetical protein [Pseudomonadales bacterium]